MAAPKQMNRLVRQAGGLVPELSFQSDGAAQKRCHQEPDDGGRDYRPHFRTQHTMVL